MISDWGDRHVYAHNVHSTGTLQLFAIIFLVMIWAEWIKKESLSCCIEEQYIIMETKVSLRNYGDKESLCFQDIER